MGDIKREGPIYNSYPCIYNLEQGRGKVFQAQIGIYLESDGDLHSQRNYYMRAPMNLIIKSANHIKHREIFFTKP